jgi:hypothetical protein
MRLFRTVRDLLLLISSAVLVISLLVAPLFSGEGTPDRAGLAADSSSVAVDDHLQCADDRRVTDHFHLATSTSEDTQTRPTKTTSARRAAPRSLKDFDEIRTKSDGMSLPLRRSEPSPYSSSTTRTV